MATLGSKSEGSIIKLKENGVLVEFYVAKHNYESGLNSSGRTLVVRKECYDERVWHTSNVNSYASSSIDSWLNSTYKNLLDSGIRTAMSTTTFYYTPYYNGTVTTLGRSVFLLSAVELGLGQGNHNNEGTELPISETLKNTTLNGSIYIQWTRSPITTKGYYAVGAYGTGGVGGYECSTSHGSRPAFTLPASLTVNSDSTVTTNTAPGTPASISVPSSIRGGTSITISWGSSTDSEGNLEGYIVERSTNGGSSWTQIYQGSSRSTTNTVSYGTSTVMYRVRAYDSEGLYSGYKTSSNVTVINNSAPSAPSSITVPTAVAGGGTLTVSWGASSDSDGNLSGYVLERQANGGSWTQVYKGSARSYTDTITAGWSTVAYRVRAYDTYSEYSSYTTSPTRTVTNNTAPTTPASISIPEDIQGGTSITISWSAATDSEGNLEGYVLERSTDGGGTWTQVYQGSYTQTTNTVPAGSDSIMYRVRAYDSEGLYSSYKSSSQVTVINNSPPSVPASITVPNEVLGGGKVTITWGVSTDSDGNLSGYALERQVDGGAWAEVFRGNALSFTDDVTRGWASVAYRVRAYDTRTAYSGYATSDTRTVNNNTAPEITCASPSGSDLGKKDSGFAVSYTVSDADGDQVSVTEAIDGVTKRTFTATLGGSNSFQVTGETYMKLLNGEHTLSITANDGKTSTVHSLTFSKDITAASVTLDEPMEADDQITICVLSVAGFIPADAEYKVEVTNNAKDDAPVWEDCTAEVKSGANYIFKNDTATNGFAFNFRVSAERGVNGEGGYIASVQGGFQ